MNPFENDKSGQLNFNYSAFVREQVGDMSVGDSKMVDIGEDTVGFRSRLCMYYPKQFRTKRDAEGNIWVKRVAEGV